MPPSSLVQRVVAETEGGWEECGVTLSLTTHPGPHITCGEVSALRNGECLLNC